MTDTNTTAAASTTQATTSAATSSTGANAASTAMADQTAASQAATTQTTGAQTSGAPQLSQEILDWGKAKGYQDGDLQNFAKDPQAYKLMTSYREAEKMLGSLQSGDKIVLPKDANDKAAWDAIHVKMGRPESADKYQIEIPQGGDSNFALEAGKWFHEAGLNQTQVAALNKHWNGYVQQAMERQNADLAVKAAEEVTALEKDWGPNAKVNGEVATRGLNLMGKELGLTPERLEQIKSGNNVTLSAGEALKLFRMVGDLGKTTNDTFEGAGTGERAGGLNMTPSDAQAKLDRLQKDPAFYQRLQNKDAAAVKERDDLFKIIASGMPKVA